MGLNVKQFREFIVRPALQGVGLWSEGAEELIAGTAMVESNLTYVRQLGGGPAIGICQMEPATYIDLRKRLIDRHPVLAQKILELDKKFMLALERGQDTSSIVSAKQELRDITEPLKNAVLTSIEDVKGAFPAKLKGI